MFHKMALIAIDRPPHPTSLLLLDLTLSKTKKAFSGVVCSNLGFSQCGSVLGTSASMGLGDNEGMFPSRLFR